MVSVGAAVSPKDSPAVRLPIKPAILLAKEMERNQAPITKPTVFAGESLVIMDRPTGDKLSSPVVWKKYIKIRKAIESIPSSAKNLAPITIIPKPKANCDRPSTNFMGVE